MSAALTVAMAFALGALYSSAILWVSRKAGWL